MGRSASAVVDVTEGVLTPRVTSARVLHVDATSTSTSTGTGTGTGDDGLGSARERVVEAFAKGAGHGLLMLGATEVATTLSPALGFLRDLGKLFVTRLCGVPDLEQLRGQAVVEPPQAELAALAAAVPPMVGAEYVDAALLTQWWGDLGAAFADEIGAAEGEVQDWLARQNAAWNLVGRVCFHLAENREDDDYPFAFLATYTGRLSGRAKVQHAPLRKALEASSGDRAALISLLTPVTRAAAESALLAELVESGAIYDALAWTPAEAHAFLRDIPAFERAGVVVRVPDWWRARRPPRPEVSVTVGGKAPAGGVGAEALLDFKVEVTLEGEALSARELAALMEAADGLALVRGKWVELDRDKLGAVLAHWKVAERAARSGISFFEGMRLLAGAPASGAAGEGGAQPADLAAWTRVEAGDWLARTLAGLREPAALAAAAPGPELKATLRPYQEVGVRWLWFASRLRLGVCLADDMGLGKTVQVLALLALDKRKGRSAPHLLVVPASLIGNWQAEIERFTPGLRVLIAHPSALPMKQLAALPAERLGDVDLVITTYGSVARLPWVRTTAWGLVVLDEAQAIKNPGAQQTRAVKTLHAQSRIALTGTPVENRLGDLWSLFDFLNPGLLGSARAFTAFTKQLAARPEVGHAPLRRLVAPYLLRRLKSDRSIVADLPDKTEVKAYCGLARAQAALYQRAVDELQRALAAGSQGIQRKGLVLSYLLRFKQICNHPSHFLADGRWDERDSGKLGRLRELAEAIAAKQEKVLVFTQFREPTAPLAAFLTQVFGRPGLVLHGDTAVRERGALVKRFQDDDDVPFFVLSLKAGGTGLNLTAASHVIHFDRWWNPAVEDQATDRAYRIGQRRNVLVHKFVCRGTVEEKIDALIESKQGLARGVLGSGGAEVNLTELGDDELMAMVALDLGRAAAEARV